MSKLLETLQAARRVSVPLVAVKTIDPTATMKAITGALNGDAPAVVYDFVRGHQALNDAGKRVLPTLMGDDPDQDETAADPVEALVRARRVPQGTVLFHLNADGLLYHQQYEFPYQQAVWNLRDLFKRNKRMLILLASDLVLPPRLRDDVVVLDEPLPTDDELSEITTDQDVAACKGIPGRKKMTKADRLRVVEATRGLGSYAAEQAIAMAIRKDGIDLPMLWENKYSLVEQVQGLNVDREPLTFEDIGGLSQAKRFGERLFGGPHPPSLVLRVEEMEKVMGGAQGDLSGTSQDALQTLLNAFEDFNWTGIIAFGPPGSGKSLFSKALAKTYGRPSLSLDLNATKGSLVGQSEQQVRAAVKVIKAMGGSDVFAVATCNGLDTIPPELRRRFRYGLWFFDMPSKDEQQDIWRVQRKQWKIAPEDETPEGDMSGADIRSVCELSWRFGCRLLEAMDYQNLTQRSNPEIVVESRKKAMGRFLSASYPGVYTGPQAGKQDGQRSFSE